MGEVRHLRGIGEGPDTLLSVINDFLLLANQGELRSLAVISVHTDGCISTGCFIDAEAGDRLTIIAAVEDLKFCHLARINGLA